MKKYSKGEIDSMFMTKTESAKLFRDYTVDVSNVDCQNTRTSWQYNDRD